MRNPTPFGSAAPVPADRAPVAPVAASRSAPTAARTLRILELLAGDPAHGFTLAEIQRRLGFSHGNLHAILATMEATGHVIRDRVHRTYGLGPALLSIGDGARRTYPSVEQAAPYMEALADELDTECHAGMRVGDSILVVARVGPLQPMGFGVRIGERFPLTPPIGASYVAWSSSDDIGAYLRSAEGDLSRDEIERHRQVIDAIRGRGYSVHVEAGPRQRFSEAAERIVRDAATDVLESELTALAHELGHHDYVLMEPSEVAIGDVIQVDAPIFGADGAVALMIGVSFVAPWMADRPVADVAARLLATAKQITQGIGGRVPLTV